MYQENGCNASKQVCDALDRLLTAPPTSQQGQYDYRAELQRLIAAFDKHGGKWPEHHMDALLAAVERARAVAF